MKIKILVPLLIVLTMLFQLSVELLAESMDEEIHHDHIQIEQQNRDYVNDAITAQIHFKKQVQEWKNLLLRGYDQELYHKHLKQFLEQEDATSRSLQALFDHEEIGNTTRKLLMDSMQQHKAIGKQYQSLLEQHDLEHQFRIVDQLIRGADRKLDTQIEQVVTSLQADFAAQRTHLMEAEERSNSIITVIEIFGIIAVILILYTTLNRHVIKPVLLATSFSKEIANGNLQRPVEIQRKDEVGQLLQALNTMQLNQKRTQHKLAVRIKEMKTLYDLSQILRDFDKSIDEVLYAVVNALPASWQYPEICAARINYNGTNFQTDNFRDTPWKITSQILNKGKQHNLIEICYLEEKPLDDDGPFSQEEQRLLTSISKNLEENLEYREAVAESQQMEIQLHHAQKLESVGQLAAGIAHEINTPTQFVSDNTLFLQEAFADFKRLCDAYDQLRDVAASGTMQKEMVTEIKELAEEIDIDYLKEEIPQAIKQSLEGLGRISKIVQAMKEFSHPGTEEKRPTDLNRAIETTINVSRNEWRYCAELITELNPELPQVPVLPGEFNQVMLNLIVNAAHAISDVTGESKELGEIRITTRQDGGWAEIRVSDTGTGIPETIQKRIFDPFFTTKELGKGSGQGLAIVWSAIVDKHGGTIEVESEEGKGTTFIIRLPMVQDAIQ